MTINAKDLIYEIKILGSDKAVRDQVLLRQEIQLLNKELKNPAIGGEQVEKLSKQLIEAKANMSLVTSEIKQQIASAEKLKFTEGSYRALNAEIIQLKENYRNLSEADRNSTLGKDALANIETLDSKLKAIDAEMGQFQRNVGNYQQGIISAFSKMGLADLAREQIKRLETQQELLNAKVSQLKTEYHQAQESGSASLHKIEADLQQAVLEHQKLNTTVSQSKEELQKAQGGFSAFAANIKNEISGGVTNAFKQLGGVIVAAFAFQQVTSFAKESGQAFLEAEKNAGLLYNAIVNIRGESKLAFDEMLKQSQDLSAANGGSIFSDDDIMKAQTFFSVFGMGSQQIKDTIPVLIDFAEQNGLKLDEAAQIFIKGVNGQGKALKEYGITIKDTGDKNLNFASTLEQMRTRGKGAFDALGAGEQTAAKLSDSWDEFKEIVGAKVLPLLTGPLASGLSGMYQWIKKITEVPLSETMEKERISLLGVKTQLEQTNIPHEKRVALIKMLQDKYPDYLKNIDAEKVGNQELFKAIDAVNGSLVDKIVLQKFDEEIKNKNEKAGDKLVKKTKEETEAITNLAKARDLLKLAEIPGANTEQQVDFAIKKLIDYKNSLKDVFSIGQISDRFKAQGLIDDLQANYEGLISRQQEANDLTQQASKIEEERDRFAKQKGLPTLLEQIKLEEEAAKAALKTNDLNKTTNSDGPDKATKKENDYAAQLKAQEEYNLKVQKLRRDLLLSTLEDDQKELEQVYDKYQLEIEALQRKNEEILKSDKLTKAQQKKLIDENNNLIIELSGIQNEDYNAVIQRRAIEFMQKFREEVKKLSGPSSSADDPQSVLSGFDEILKQKKAELLNPLAETRAEIESNAKLEHELNIESLNDKIAALEHIGNAEKELFELKKQLHQEEMALDEMATQKRLANIDIASQAFAIGQNITSAAFEGAKNRQLKRAEQEIKDEDRLGKEKEKITKRFGIAQKAVAIVMAAVNGALAITKILAEVPKFDWGVTTWIQVGLATAATAASIATIAAQKLAKGGILGKGVSNVSGGSIPEGSGMLQGKSHADGGIKFLHNGIPYEAEGGELKTDNGNQSFIFTKGVANDDVLKRIALATHNSSGHPVAGMVASLVNMAGGGVPFFGNKFKLADGGVLGNPLPLPNISISRNAGIDLQRLIDEVNVNTIVLMDKINQRIDAVEEQKLVTPVDDISDLQTVKSKIKKSTVF